MERYKVQVIKEEGIYLLNEIKVCTEHGIISLKEGDIVEGRRSKNSNRVDIVFHGEHASLWLGVNCKRIRAKQRRLEKGATLDAICIGYIGNSWEWSADTKKELLSELYARGWKRSEIEIKWCVKTYYKGSDGYGDIEGVGDTKKEAIADFWEEYTNKQ